MTLEAGVKALAEDVGADVKEINLKIGDLSQLTTTANSNLVEAINEAAASGGGAGLTLFEESRSVASPNATVPVHALTAIGAETNIDFVIGAKGTGAIIAQVPDGTTVGGNKRGAMAVDLQTSRSHATRVASGEYSVTMGYNCTTRGSSSVAMGSSCTASGSPSVAMGSSCTASGSSSVTMGYNCTTRGSSSVAMGSSCTASGSSSVAMGSSCTASGSSSVAMGVYSTTRGVDGAISEGHSISTGMTQMERIPLRLDTANATATQLTSTGGVASATNSAVMPNNSAYNCRIRVLARNTSTNESMSWSGTALIKRGANAASTTLIGSSIASDFGDAAMSVCTVTLSADTTRGCLAVIVTGLASATIRWVAQLETVEAA